MLEGLKNDAKKIAKAAKDLLRFLILFGIVLIFKTLILNLLPSDSPNVEEEGGVIETEESDSHSTIIPLTVTAPMWTPYGG
ncbi:MAG: hypothetical protein MKZ94_14025 [Pirellulales bacterium]|nr:hypothetical protein [Pirellulales bacterium]